MELNEYQVLAQRTSNVNTKKDALLNGALGLCGESGEVADLLKKHLFQGHELDVQHMAKEVGDCLWYIAEIAVGLGYTLEEIAVMNIEKLKERYPNGFDPNLSKHRKEGDV